MDIRTLASDPAAFRSQLLVDVDGIPTPLGDVIEPWQAADFQRLDPAWLAVVGRRPGQLKQRAWLERPRGHSKTSDIAVMATWAMFASRRAIRGYAAAADKDQAGLLRDAILILCRLNPWLGELLDIQTAKVINRHTGASLMIITSDAMTSYGLLPDFVVCDEVTHWGKPDLWHSLLSAAAKRASCLMAVITNAGHKHTWQWVLREQIRRDPAWIFSRLDGPGASWITADRLAEQQRLLPAVAYSRLWLNQWGTGSGDLITEDDLQAALDAWAPVSDQKETFVAGLDLGIKHDASAFVAVGKDKALRVRVQHLRTWRAPAGGKVDLSRIEQHVARIHGTLRLRHLAADPWQASYLLDRLHKLGVPARERAQTGNRLNEQAAELVRLFQARQIAIPDDGGLLHDLRSARIEEKSYGLRITSPKDDHGHGDTLTALTIAVAEAKGVRAGYAAMLPPPAMMRAMPARVAEHERAILAAMDSAAIKYKVKTGARRFAIEGDEQKFVRRVLGMHVR